MANGGKLPQQTYRLNNQLIGKVEQGITTTINEKEGLMERWSWAQAIAAQRATWQARMEAAVPTLLAVASRLATKWSQQHLLANTAAAKQST
jgi:hypothetical protein